MMRQVGRMIKRGLNNDGYASWSKDELIERIAQLEGRSLPVEAGVDDASVARLPKKAKKMFDFASQPKRFVAIKFAYLGWNYSGLAFQYEPTPLPTVEQCIVDALAKAKLIEKADPECCNFSRCGRTDRGVSAMNQVISLTVRSQLPEESRDKEYDEKELPYKSILNSMLPADIRVTQVCLRPPHDFDARFSCLYRHYRYFFSSKGLDLDLMRQAAKKYEGIHDFRNFCKIDGSKQITNFMREVHLADICNLRDDIWYFDLKGSAFLWHQVRCMVAILFLAGQRLESTSVVDDLLNIEKYPARPVYEMANDIPLVLYNCHYPQMEWLDGEDSKSSRFYAQYEGVLTDYKIKSVMAQLLDEWFVGNKFEPQSGPNGGLVNVGDGCGRNYKKYVPISARQVGVPPEIVNERYRQRKAQKQEEEKEKCEHKVSGKDK